MGRRGGGEVGRRGGGKDDTPSLDLLGLVGL